MKFRIEKNIESQSLESRVPTEYKSIARCSEAEISNTCTLITFPHNRKDVVKKNLVEKALKKLDNPMEEQLVVLGGCFSLESVDALKPYQVIFLSLSEFPWSDAKNNEIKSDSPKN
jgi:hypothetical protein